MIIDKNYWWDAGKTIQKSALQQKEYTLFSIHWLASSFLINILSANDLLKGLLAWWKTNMDIHCALSLDHLASTHFPPCII